MENIPIKVLFYVIACLLSVADCDYFTVVGPKTLRIDEPYKFAVTSHDAHASSETITIGIEGSGFDGRQYKVYKNVTTVPGETKTADLVVRLNLCL